MKLGVLWLSQLYDHQNDSCENTKCHKPWLPEHKTLQYISLSIVRMEIIGIIMTNREINQLYKPLGLRSPTSIPH